MERERLEQKELDPTTSGPKMARKGVPDWLQQIEAIKMPKYTEPVEKAGLSFLSNKKKAENSVKEKSNIPKEEEINQKEKVNKKLDFQPKEEQLLDEVQFEEPVLDEVQFDEPIVEEAKIEPAIE
mmetsp:Transcript_10824/g.9553  ORF Transcript_10824/g.9553 Transcript_10824/m.9553 type:complete len:125 (-) Transcript_10824:26-400(-)